MKAKAYIVHYAMSEPELEWRKPKDCLSAEPLYPKHEWQGLTDEQWEAIKNARTQVKEAIEAQLKENNT